MSRCRTWVAVASLTILSANATLLYGQDKMMDGMKMTPEHMQTMMNGWAQASKDAAKFMTDKYGAPASMTAEMATWGKTGPWKRTIVYGKEYVHEFPAHHTDVMQQWIDYKAPPKSDSNFTI